MTQQMQTTSSEKLAQNDRIHKVRGNLLRMEADIREMLPRTMGFERFLSVTMGAISSAPDLAFCAGLYSSILAFACLGLEPNTPLGHAYLIPRKVDGVLTCTRQFGYQGLLELAYRSDRVSSVSANVVKLGDDFDWLEGDQEFIKHRRGDDPNWHNLDTTHAWAVVRGRDAGARWMRVLTKGEVDKRKAVGSGGFGWASWYDEMAKKTALRAVLKIAPRSAEVSQAISIEDADSQGALMAALPMKAGRALEKARLESLPEEGNGHSGPGAGAKAAAKARKGSKPEPVVEQRRPPPEEQAQPTEEDVWVGRFIKAGAKDAEEATRMMAEGWEIDPQSGKAVPPAGGEP